MAGRGMVMRGLSGSFRGAHRKRQGALYALRPPGNLSYLSVRLQLMKGKPKAGEKGCDAVAMASCAFLLCRVLSSFLLGKDFIGLCRSVAVDLNQNSKL